MTNANLANFGIVSWGDPIVGSAPDAQGRVIVEGLVPIELGREMKALCKAHNARSTPFAQLDWLTGLAAELEMDRSLIEGLVPDVVAKQLLALCHQHNATIPGRA
mgnify:CR=1 FL=1